MVRRLGSFLPPIWGRERLPHASPVRLLDMRYGVSLDCFNSARVEVWPDEDISPCIVAAGSSTSAQLRSWARDGAIRAPPTVLELLHSFC